MLSRVRAATVGVCVRARGENEEWSLLQPSRCRRESLQIGSAQVLGLCGRSNPGRCECGGLLIAVELRLVTYFASYPSCHRFRGSVRRLSKSPPLHSGRRPSPSLHCGAPCMHVRSSAVICNHGRPARDRISRQGDRFVSHQLHLPAIQAPAAASGLMSSRQDRTSSPTLQSLTLRRRLSSAILPLSRECASDVLRSPRRAQA